MNALKNNWLTEDHIDFEYKKYMVLGYMQDVKRQYERNELYPVLADLIEHYKNLKQIKDNADSIKKGFSKEITGIDWQKLELIHNKKNIQGDVFQELEQIIDFSMPLFEEKINTGKEIYDYVEKNLSIATIGISPLRKQEGYLIIHTQHHKEAYVYQYELSVLQDIKEKTKQLFTKYINVYTYNITNTFERIKQDLISTHRKLPNPAVYAIKSNICAPFNETLLPIAKRFFVSSLII